MTLIGHQLFANQASALLDRSVPPLRVRRGRTLNITVSIATVVTLHLHPWQLHYIYILLF